MMLLKRAASHARMCEHTIWGSAVIQEINSATQKITLHTEHKFGLIFLSLYPVLCANLLSCIPKFSHDCDSLLI